MAKLDYNFIMGETLFRRVGDLVPKNMSDGAKNSTSIKAFDVRLWRTIAGENIASHTYVLIEKNIAVIYADSAIWVHTANQRRISFLNSIRDRGFDVEAIQVRNQPPVPSQTRRQNKQKPLPISFASSESLKQTALTMHHKQLKQALLRLCRHYSDSDT